MTLNYQKSIANRIRLLKKEKNAIILAHNYVLGEIQDVADYCGDSLELSIKASRIEKQDVIVFCGVKFMAETAKILSPQKRVILPVIDALCPMADMANAEEVRKLKRKHPGAVTVCYVNSTAEVKTEVDICCTSGNAEKIVNSIPKDRQIIFIPDKNLGANVAKKIGKKMILWDGFCPTHMRITTEMIKKKREEFPGAVVIVHPECTPEVVELSDEALSTSGMLDFAKKSKAKQIIVGTEMGIIHRMQKENPAKMFISISEQAVCMNMKKITLEDVFNSLEKMQYEINLDPVTIEKAKKPILRMLKEKL